MQPRAEGLARLGHLLQIPSKPSRVDLPESIHHNHPPPHGLFFFQTSTQGWNIESQLVSRGSRNGLYDFRAGANADQGSSLEDRVVRVEGENDNGRTWQCGRARWAILSVRVFLG